MLTKYQQFFTGRPTVEIAKDLLGKLVKYQTTMGSLVVILLKQKHI